MLVQQKRLQSVYREINHNDRLAYILIAVITASVTIIEFHEIFTVDPIYNGYKFVQQTIEPNCSWDSLPYGRGGINWYLVCVSYLGTGNSNVVPFTISMGLVPMSFLFARKYGGNLAGMLTAIGLVLNPVFLIFDSVSAYAQTWAVFFLASLYLIKKFSMLSAITFNLALFSKAIPMAWGPFIIYGIFRSKMAPNKKYVLYAGIGIPLIILWSLSLFDGGSMVYGYMSFKPVSYQSLIDTISWTWTAFRWNEEILFAMPVLFGIYLWKKKKWQIPVLPMELLAVSMVSFFGIAFFTVEGYFPYRILPNLVMFLFAAATLLQKGLEARFRL